MRQDKIIRAPRNSEHPYMQLIRKIPQDTRMTLEERGFLIYMLSLPVSWEVNPDHLCRTQGVGEKKLRAIFKKLESLGYCQVKQIRDSKGKYSHNEYLIFEESIDTPSHNDCEPSGNFCRAAETATPFLPDGCLEDNTYTQRRDTRDKEYNTPTPTNKKAAEPPAADAASGGGKFSSVVKEVGAKMVSMLKDANPVYRPPKDAAVLLKHVRLLVEEDRQDPEQILKAFHWAANDDEERGDFKGWQSVISSKNPVQTFRKHFAKICSQMKSKPKRKFAPCSDDNEALAAIKSMREHAL